MTTRVLEMINVEIANGTRKDFNSRLAKTYALKVLEGELGRGAKDIEVSVAFVGPSKIRELNKKWRKTDCVTDVLSFTEEDFLKRHSGGNLLEHEFLGEIIICPAQVAKDAKELQKTLNQELSWVVVHGALHLLGYDHEHGGKDALTMRKKEEFYLGSKI